MTNHGYTALIWASYNGNLEIVRLLLRHGADKQAANFFGRTARFYASRHPLVLAALA